MALVLMTGSIAGCSSDGSGDGTIDELKFGSQDTTCSSVILNNDPDDQAVLAGAVDCLLGEIDGGRPVTVDVIMPTVEGDPMYHRFGYDGTEVLIVEDFRADQYGPRTIAARLCLGLEPGSWLPIGTQCTTISHVGFEQSPS